MTAALLVSLLPIQRQTFLDSLNDEEANILLHDWRFWARPKQLPPDGDWFGWLLRSGRGFGKTRAGAEWIIERARDGPYYPIALVGETKADVRDTMIEIGESSIMRVSPPWFRPEFQPSKRRVVWPNGMVAVAYSGDEPDQLRGPQHGSAWVDELAKFKYPEDTWDNLELGLRLGPKPQVVVTTTPRPIPVIKALIADPMIIDVQGSTYENVANLPRSFIDRVLGKYEGTFLGRQEVHGEVLEDREGALWRRQEDIEDHRAMQHPPLVRIVVGVDPPGKNTGAECGIVVAGIDSAGQGYVIEDRSLQASPAKWGAAVVTAYHHNRADRVVAETNFGGEMVENTLRTVQGGARLSYKPVHASRGKVIRAEPIAALYEQGKVHHVGQFGELEDQQCTWVQGEGPSPDRVDALVWALTELMLTKPKGKVGTSWY